jgi:Rieske Fe-S protein
MIMSSDEKIPDPFGTDVEGTSWSAGRRGFLKVAAAALYTAMGTLLALPFLKTLITPAVMQRSQFSRVGDLDGFPVGLPVDVHFSAQAQDAFYHGEVLHVVWVLKHEDGSVDAFSPVCPHLGCHYEWNPPAGQFQCPCHASSFAKDGTVLGGPAPRPLDTLPQKIVGGTLYVRWVDYTPGIPGKVAV